VLRREEIDTLLNQVAQALTAQGVTGRHQPLSSNAPGDGDGDQAPLDPRYAAALQALENDDVDGAVAEYQRLVDANPADTEAASGLAMAKTLQRTRGVEEKAAREAADAHPDDVAAQTLVADLDLIGGDVDAAFDRLVELVRRTSGEERNHAREHLIGLFAAVGNDDPRVLRGRQNLASALF
jgi:putative thioredoxin